MATVKKISFQHQTMFAELASKAFDASFLDDFPPNGSFNIQVSKGREYYYYYGYEAAKESGAGKRYTKYVGPKDDPEVSSRVEHFEQIKHDYKERQTLVRSLVSAGLPAPLSSAGDIIEALERAGVFRLNCVLVGTMAFQTYAGLLGVRMPGSITATGDADFAQFYATSKEVGDAVPPLVDVLRKVDPSFTAIPAMTEPQRSTTFRNGSHFSIEFLTPNRGSNDLLSKPATMPALGGVSAQPLRYLDYLIHEPVRTVLLHKAGVQVRVPAPAKYAVHKTIISNLRHNDVISLAKSRKDLEQAELLIEAFSLQRRLDDLGFAWLEAYDRGPRWREQLSRGMHRLSKDAIENLQHGVNQAAQRLGKPPIDFSPVKKNVSNLYKTTDLDFP